MADLRQFSVQLANRTYHTQGAVTFANAVKVLHSTNPNVRIMRPVGVSVGRLAAQAVHTYNRLMENELGTV